MESQEGSGRVVSKKKKKGTSVVKAQPLPGSPIAQEPPAYALRQPQDSQMPINDQEDDVGTDVNRSSNMLKGKAKAKKPKSEKRFDS